MRTYFSLSLPSNIEFVCGHFSLSPASFYLEHNEVREIHCVFKERDGWDPLDIGVEKMDFDIESDNLTTQEASIEVCLEALRVEMKGFSRPTHVAISKEVGTVEFRERTGEGGGEGRGAFRWDEKDQTLIRIGLGVRFGGSFL